MHYILSFIITIALSSTLAIAETALPTTLENARNYSLFKPNTASSGSLNLDGAPRELEESGFKSIIDLRTAREGTKASKQAFEDSGVTYYNLQTTAPDILKNPTLIEKFANIYENAPKPVLIQCGSGNRVGAVWTEYLITQKGAKLDEAIEEGKKAGMQSYLEYELRKKYSDPILYAF